MNERIQEILDHPVTIPATVGVVSFVGGATVGYLIGRRGKAVVPHEIVTPELGVTIVEEDEEIIAPPPVVVDAEVYENPIVVDETVIAEQEEAAELIAEYNGSDDEADVDETITVDDTPVPHRIFADDTWNWEEENAYRETLNANQPYVIHKEEYWAQESGFGQSTLNFYEGDGVLADDKDIPILKHEVDVGPIRFGHGSGDPNVCYVRVPKTGNEHEILRSLNAHHLEVLGQDADDAADEEFERAPRRRGHQEE